VAGDIEEYMPEKKEPFPDGIDSIRIALQ